MCQPLLPKMAFRVVCVLPTPYLQVFTSSTIYIHQHNSRISALGCGCNPILSLLMPLLQVFPIWPLGVPLGWFLHSFNMPEIVFEHIFTSDKTRCSGLWYFSLPQTWDQPFLQGVLVPFTEERCFINQDLAAKLSSLLPGYHCFQNFSAELEDICVC